MIAVFSEVAFEKRFMAFAAIPPRNSDIMPTAAYAPMYLARAVAGLEM